MSSDSFDIASSDNGMQVPEEREIRRSSNAALSPTSNVALGRRSSGEILSAPIASTQQRSDTSNRNRNRNVNGSIEIQKEIYLTPVTNEQQQWYITMTFMAFFVIFAAVVIHFMCRIDLIDSRIKDIETKLNDMIEKIQADS